MNKLNSSTTLIHLTLDISLSLSFPVPYCIAGVYVICNLHCTVPDFVDEMAGTKRSISTSDTIRVRIDMAVALD